MKESEVQWIDASKELPDWTYAWVPVLLAWKDHPDWGYSIQFAELRYFGGDKSRPYWTKGKSGNYQCIENDAMYVKYWCYPFKMPT